MTDSFGWFRIETKGLDYLDKQKAKKHAEEQVKQYYEKEHM
jgi:hypothetical protein